MTWTAAIIVSAKRGRLVLDTVLPAIIEAEPSQILLVGELDPSHQLEAQIPQTWERPNLRYLHVPPLAHNTNDALVKRDVAAVANTSDLIAYFCDDHMPAPDFGEQIRKLPDDYDVWVPARYAGQSGPHYGERLNNGEAVEELPLPGQWRDTAIGHYCGGHAGVYRKSLIERYPWTAGPHHREWDLLNSRRLMDAGARFCWTDQLRVYDCEPNATPWL